MRSVLLRHLSEFQKLFENNNLGLELSDDQEHMEGSYLLVKLKLVLNV